MPWWTPSRTGSSPDSGTRCSSERGATRCSRSSCSECSGKKASFSGTNAAEWVEADAAVAWDRLPARVDAVIAERIGRIPPGLQRVLSVASAEGERFTLEAVARVLAVEARDLVAALSAELEQKHQLIVAEGFERFGEQSLSTYRFRHILFQRFLYDRLDLVERAHFHERLGEALETLYGARGDEIAVALAHHFGEAGLPDRAAAWFFAAGEQAQRSLAPEEALAHYEAALGMLRQVPASEARDRLELSIQLAIGKTRIGLIAPGYAEAYERALELAPAVGTPVQLFWASFGSFTVGYYANDRSRARTSAQTALSAARSLEDPGTLQLMLGFAALEAKARAARTEAEQYLREAISLPESRPCIPIWDDGGRAFAQSVLGSTRWELGFADQAARLTGTAVERARETNKATVLQIMLFRDILIRVWGGDIRGARPRCDEALVSMKEVSIAGNGPPMMVCAGWCEVLSGRIEPGLEILEDALQQYEAAGTRVFSAYMWALYARALGIAGRPGEGLRRVERVIADRLEDENGWAAETFRHLGELRLAVPRPDEKSAETAFRTALEIAREQKTPSWELLATTSLARLLRKQDRVGEARDMLGAIYAWFTEGFDWPYLVEARDLLTELETTG